MTALSLETALLWLDYCTANMKGCRLSDNDAFSAVLEIEGWPAEIRVTLTSHETLGKIISFSLISNSSPPDGYPLSKQLREIIEELNNEDNSVGDSLNVWHIIEPTKSRSDRLDLLTALICTEEGGLTPEEIPSLFISLAKINAQLNLKAVHGGFLS